MRVTLRSGLRGRGRRGRRARRFIFARGGAGCVAGLGRPASLPPPSVPPAGRAGSAPRLCPPRRGPRRRAPAPGNARAPRPPPRRQPAPSRPGRSGRGKKRRLPLRPGRPGLALPWVGGRPRESRAVTGRGRAGKLAWGALEAGRPLNRGGLVRGPPDPVASLQRVLPEVPNYKTFSSLKSETKACAQATGD